MLPCSHNIWTFLTIPRFFNKKAGTKDLVLPPEAPLGRGFEVFAECRTLKLDSRDLETKNDRGMATMPREIQEIIYSVTKQYGPYYM